MKKNLFFSAVGVILLFTACVNQLEPDSADPGVPVISAHPKSAVYSAGNAAQALTVTASVNDGGTLSYKWYKNTNNSNNGGTSVSDSSNSNYMPPTNEVGTLYYYVVVTNTLNGKTAGVASNTAAITIGEETPTYSIHIDITGEESGDTITFSPDTGKEGDIVTINYTVANTKLNNSLNFSGTTTHIAPVNSKGGGVRQYTVNTADASNGAITIRAVFFHANLNLDPIAFNDNRGVIHVTYGDPAFTNAVASGYSGNGAITYTSSNTSVANVNSSGQVTIYKAGSTIIKAEKAEDSVYAYAQTDYTLNVDPKPLAITGLSVQDKIYDGSAVATVSGTAVLNGKVGSDNVTIVTGTAAFTDANAGTNKQIIFNGWSLSGTDAGNYTLSLPEITANINKADGRTVTKPASTTVTGSSITVGAVTVSTPAYGQTAEYAISLNVSPVPVTGWQDGTTFNGLNSNTNYYVFARSKSNTNCNAGAAQTSNVIKTSAGGQPPDVPRFTLIDFEDKALNTTYGFTSGDNNPTVKVVADPANSGQKSLQITTNPGGGSQGYNQAAVIPINLPYELQKYKSFSFRLRIVGGAGLASAQTVHVYAAKNSASFVKWGFGNPSNNSNQFAANLVGTTTLTTTALNTWTDYVITITAANLDNAIKTLQGDINIAIGINVGSAADYMIDDLTFTLMDNYFPEPPFMLPTTPLSPPSTGAVVSGNYRNMFVEMGKSPAEVTAKVQYAWEHLFYGRTQDTDTNSSNNKNDCIYYPVGSDMAYIYAVDSNDVRSEGMSYGMMMCVQLDKKAEFDRLWKWAKTYMYHETNVGKNSRGYFSWQCRTDGSSIDVAPAPDGEIYFITSLLFASARWGDGTGIFNYGLEARKVLYELIRRDTGKGDNWGEPPLFNTDNYMVRFGPQGSTATFTDPSYHLPAFYEIWAEEIQNGTQYWNAVWGNSTDPLADAQFWRNAAAASRPYFQAATHPTTGLGPDYSNFNGTPYGSGAHARFEYDAWRIAMNIASDYAWWAKDPWEKTHADRILSFFDGKGITSYGDRWELNGTQVGADHSTGLVACNAVASLAATDPRAWKFLDEFWNKGVDTGFYRYYNNCLYMLAMLHCSGNFRAYTSSSSGVSSSSITPTSATFDKRADLQKDIVVTMTLNGNTLTAIKNGGANLTQGTNYTLSGNIVTINKSYLSGLAIGTTTLTFVFSSGSDRTLSITVQQTPAGQATAITPTTEVFDKRTDLQSDILVTMTLDGNAFSNITNGGTLLTQGTNYTVSGNTVTLKSSYLASLSVGSVTLVFNFTGGITRNLVITVKESPAAGSLHTEYDFAAGDIIPAGFPQYGGSGTMTVETNGGALVVTKTNTNNSTPKFILPFNIGTENLSDYSGIEVEIRGVTGDYTYKDFRVEVGSTQLGSVASSLSTTFKVITVPISGGAGFSGDVDIGFLLNNTQGYTIEIRRITLIHK